MSKSARGFSLIELLAVLAVVAVLGAIIIPVVSKVRSNGHNTTCQSNLRQIWTAINLYAADNRSFPRSEAEGEDYIPWYRILLGEMAGADYDNEAGAFIPGSAGTNYLGSPGVLGCPSGEYTYLDTRTQSKWPVSYGMANLNTWVGDGTRTDSLPTFFTTTLFRSSQWPLVMDADYQIIFSLDSPTEDANRKQRFSARHGDYANIMMADGHIEQAAYGDTRWSQSNLNNNHLYD